MGGCRWTSRDVSPDETFKKVDPTFGTGKCLGKFLLLVGVTQMSVVVFYPGKMVRNM